MNTINELVSLQNVTKVYEGNVPAVNNVNLLIPRGKIIGLLGPNGSGKSTLIKMMNGLLTPTYGTILINGYVPGPETKAHVSYLPERSYLSNAMNVDQLIELFGDFYEDFNPDRAYHMLDSLHIDPGARLKTLSKGTKEKVQLILVMSREADLYILDEPIAGVDPAARDYILKTILTNYNENATILLSTHLISDVENILDDIIFIRKGEILLYAPADAIRTREGKSIDAYFREVFVC